MKYIILMPLLLLLSLQANALIIINPTDVLTSESTCDGNQIACDFSEDEIRKALNLSKEDHIDYNYLDSLQVEHVDFHDEDYDLIEIEDIAAPTDPQVKIYNANLRMPHDRAPIWPSFIENFKQCAPGCIPANYGTYGKRGGRSCHPTGRAVDVGAIICNGNTHPALSGGEFSTFVECMKGHMKTLYRNGKHVTKGHRDHAHFSNGCRVNNRYTY